MQWASLEDTRALEEECTWAERDVPVTLYELLTRTKNNFGSRPAVSYQLTSGPKDKAETLSWNELHQKTTQAANMIRALGVGPRSLIAGAPMKKGSCNLKEYSIFQNELETIEGIYKVYEKKKLEDELDDLSIDKESKSEL